MDSPEHSITRNGPDDLSSSSKPNPTLLSLPFIAAMAALIALNPMRVNGDCAIYLDMARMLIEGKRLYVDFGEVNPPLIIYMSAIPQLLANLLTVHVILIFLILVLGLVTWSTLFINRVLVRSGLGLGCEETSVLLACWTAFSAWVYVLGEFGQRDHLFTLLFVPYFYIRWVRWEGGRISSFAALLAGFTGAVGVCIKPYFLLVPAACEVYWMVSNRRVDRLIRIETVAFILTGVSYGIHFLLLPEIVRKTLFGWWLPFVASSFYSYSKPFLSLVQDVSFPVAVTIALFPLVSRSSLPGHVWRLARSLSILVMAGLVTYLWQHRGFSYHTFPYLAGVSMILGCVVGKTVSFGDKPLAAKTFSIPISLRRVSFLMSAAVAVLFVVLLVGIATGQVAFRSGTRSGLAGLPETPYTKIISEYTVRGDRILTITTTVGGPNYPALLQMDRKPAHRYFFTFWMGMLYAGLKPLPDGKFPYRSRAEASKAEARLLAELEEDIVLYRPKLIFIQNDKSCQGCPPGFNVMDYVIKMGLLENAMKGYRKLPAVPGFDVYVRGAGPA